MTSKSSEDDRPLPASPCCRRCCLDDVDVCVGCGRSLEEILDWNEADAPRRLAILDAARRRLRDRESGWR